MSQFPFVQSPRFCVLATVGRTCFVEDGTDRTVLFEGSSAEIVHALWTAASCAPGTENHLSRLSRSHQEQTISEALAAMVNEGILIQGGAPGAGLPRALSCERLLVCMTGAIQTANFAPFLLALRLRFCREMRIVLTAAARKLVRGRALGQLLDAKVYRDTFEGTSDGLGVPHIALAEWASCILVAPATASAVHRVAYATCDDLLSLTIAAAPADVPVVIGPSMNSRMWGDGSVRENVERCRARGYWVIEPGQGVEANTSWGERVAQGGVFGATPSKLVRAMDAVVRIHGQGDA